MYKDKKNNLLNVDVLIATLSYIPNIVINYQFVVVHFENLFGYKRFSLFVSIYSLVHNHIMQSAANLPISIILLRMTLLLEN